MNLESVLDSMIEQANSLGQKTAAIVERMDADTNEKKIQELTRQLEEIEAQPYSADLDKKHQKLMRERAALGWRPGWSIGGTGYKK